MKQSDGTMITFYPWSSSLTRRGPRIFGQNAGIIISHQAVFDLGLVYTSVSGVLPYLQLELNRTRGEVIFVGCSVVNPCFLTNVFRLTRNVVFPDDF